MDNWLVIEPNYLLIVIISLIVQYYAFGLVTAWAIWRIRKGRKLKRLEEEVRNHEKSMKCKHLKYVKYLGNNKYLCECGGVFEDHSDEAKEMVEMSENANSRTKEK